MSNAMMIIFPSRYEYTWVFDDEQILPGNAEENILQSGKTSCIVVGDTL